MDSFSTHGLSSLGCSCFCCPFNTYIYHKYTINSDLLFEQINIIIKIIHESSGSVFLVMNDNHSANIKWYDQFHRSFRSLNEFSIPHPIKTDTFNCLFLLYDPVHLFKNIKSNWITEKMKTLKFHDFQTMDLIAEWKDIVAIYESEKGLIVKRTKLDYATIYP